MVSVINMCYSTIYLLYSEAMRVAGIQAPAAGMEAQQLEAVKGASRQVAEAAVGGMKDTVAGQKGIKPGAAKQIEMKSEGEEEDGAGAEVE